MVTKKNDVHIYQNDVGRNVPSTGVTIIGGSLTIAGETARVSLGYDQITNADLATVQALEVPTGATIAEVQNTGSQPCRWRDDGPDPTSATGRVIAPDDTQRFTGDLSKLRFIRGADGVTLDITFYRLAE